MQVAFDIDGARPAISKRLSRGLKALSVPEPMTLKEWAAENFYLSAESSYVEQRWHAWPFQKAILSCISNDDIKEVDFIKSARVGYTKMICAAIGYNAHHRRRNQCIWQPTDDDRDEFVKTEIDPMLRDVPVMQDVFPSYMARHKDNTLQTKKFLGSMLYMRGGKAAKNYRRISIDIGYLDELDAFDLDVEKEGDPFTLANKRVEGATFPKIVCGSTPKLRGFSQIETRVQNADLCFDFMVPCPHCDEFHALTWGGKDEPHGFKWDNDNPESVVHLCPHCAAVIKQGDYLRVWEAGRWQSASGVTINDQGLFFDQTGQQIFPARHIAFHIWTAYSPAATWSSLVREFLAAFAKMQEGDTSKMKAFYNTTLGRTWEGDIEGEDAESLKHRAEPFPLRLAPRGCLIALAGVDVQDNRIEVEVTGYGRGCETWTLDHQVLFGNPAEDEVWTALKEFLFETRYKHVAGTEIPIHAAAIDSGGHHTHAVYEFARLYRRHRVFAVKGRSGAEKHIKDGAGPVDIDWRGRRHKRGVILWHVGTNLAKDLLYSRLQITKPGSGYIHLSNELSDEWFRQLAGEVRATRQTARGHQSRWTAIRKRVEALDMIVYTIWLEVHLGLGTKSERFWNALEEKVQPLNRDLFEHTSNPKEPEPPTPSEQLTAERRQQRQRVKRKGGFVRRW